MNCCFQKEKYKNHPNENTFVKIAASFPPSSTLWCYITVSVGWPQDQLTNNCVERRNNLGPRSVFDSMRPLLLDLHTLGQYCPHW